MMIRIVSRLGCPNIPFPLSVAHLSVLVSADPKRAVVFLCPLCRPTFPWVTHPSTATRVDNGPIEHQAMTVLPDFFSKMRIYSNYTTMSLGRGDAEGPCPRARELVLADPKVGVIGLAPSNLPNRGEYE